MLQEKEKGNFETLLNYTHNNPNGVYLLFDEKGASIEAVYDTDYETDNGLELSDTQYEEYIGIAFKAVESGNLFEISYKNLPSSVVCDGITIY